MQEASKQAILAFGKNRWRGGRAVECAGFEIQYGLRVIGGSNPPLSVEIKGIRNGVTEVMPFRPFWCTLRGITRLRDFAVPTRI